MAHEPPGEKIRLGILGAGGIARRRVLPALRGHPLIDVTSVMDPSAAGDIAAEFSVPGHHREAAALIDDPRVDAVYIASPVAFHAEQIWAAAAAGKAVFCEKPVARTREETARAVAACRRHGVLFMEGFMMNFHGAHQVIRRMVTEGAIGRPVSMRAQLSCWYPPVAGSWRQDPDRGGGGALIDMATHCYSLLEFLTGDRITGVFAMVGSQVHRYASEDSATTLLRLAGGCHATVDSFYCVPDTSSANRLEIYGDEGSIFCEGTIGQDAGGTIGLFSGKNADYDSMQAGRSRDLGRPVPFDEVNPYAAEFEHFARCRREGRPPAVNGAEAALHMAGLVDGAYLSWREKRFVTI